MKTIQMQVSEGLSIMIMPDSSHEFLIPTRDVAKGYDIKESSLRSHLHRYKDDIVENQHYVRGVAVCNTLDKRSGIQPYQLFWTKAGVIRLAMFIKSERAKLFRDWVENLVLDYLEKKLPQLPEAPRRKHNRLTPERLLDIMSDVCLIQDHTLRTRIAGKIMGEH